jgi:hypothetical protein
MVLFFAIGRHIVGREYFLMCTEFVIEEIGGIIVGGFRTV